MTASSTLPPDEICGYTVVRRLNPRTFLAFADAGQQVVLKPLDTDCLLHGQLHPSIKQRLSRVRELALKGGANLHGVERDEHGVYLVWEFVDGQTLQERIAEIDPSQLASLAREVILSIEALHALGLVHGALHGRNVIIDPTGRPRLTHVSPLLYDDPLADTTAITNLLNDLIGQRIEPTDPLAQLLATSTKRGMSLRQLATGLATLSNTERDEVVDKHADDEDRRRRRGTLLWALGLAAAGLIFAAVIAILARK